MSRKRKCRAANPATCRIHGFRSTVMPQPVSGVRRKSGQTAKGVNVSAFETSFLAELNNLIQPNSENEIDWEQIPDKNRPVLFRGKTTEQIKTAAQELVSSIRSELDIPEGEPLEIEYSRDNHTVGDLYVKNRDTYVELKLGSATDSNAGLATIMGLFPDHLQELLPSLKDRREWRALYEQSNGSKAVVEYITQQHKQKLETFAAEVNKLTGQKITNKGQSTMNSYWLSVNPAKEMDKTESKKVVRFTYRGDTWETTSRSRIANGFWRYGTAYVDEKTGRLSLNIEHSDQPYSLRLAYNYKNNYRVNANLTAPAKLGLGSPSFNGWWLENRFTK